MEPNAVQRRIHEDLIPKEKTFIDNTGTLLDVHLRTADMLLDWGRRDLAEKLREEMEGVLRLRFKMENHIRALESVSEDYNYDPNQTTEFEEQITQRTEQLQSRRINIEETEEYKLYQNCLAKYAQGGPSAVVEDEFEDDLEVIDDSTAYAQNLQCPISGKRVEDISHPVMDQMGYVYEREAIHREIDRQQRRELQCPAAGTTHIVRREHLRPAYAAIRGVKRKRKETQCSIAI